MKTKNISILVLALVSSLTAFAQEAPQAKEASSDNNSQTQKISPRFKERILKEFDKDGDGFLNEEELAAAKKAFAERKNRFETMRLEYAKKVMGEFDKDNDGKLSTEELSLLLEQHRRMMLELQRSYENGTAQVPPEFRHGEQRPQRPPRAEGDRPQRRFGGDNNSPDARLGEKVKNIKERQKQGERQMKRPNIDDLDSLAKPKE